MSTRSTARRRIAVPLAIVLALATVPALTGCFGNPIEGAINAATGNKVHIGGGSLPTGFPSAVPVYKGKIDAGISLGSGSKAVYNVTVEVPGASAASDIKSELQGAGFKIEEDATSSSGASLLASSKDCGVLVALTDSGTNKQWVANYTVTAASSSNN